MSRMEYHVGTVQEICIEQNNFEDKYKFAVDNFGLTPHEGDTDWDFYVGDEKFFYLEGLNKMFMFISNDENEYGHCLIKESKTDPSIYDYTLSFYNGGGDFEEVFEDTLKESLNDD